MDFKEVQKMSFVEKDHMTDLRTAAESLETSLTSEDTIQIKSVAYAINTAANTGSTRVVFQEPLRNAVKEELISKGYTITRITAANLVGQSLISWKPEPNTEENNG